MRVKVNVLNPDTKSEHVEYISSLEELTLMYALIDRWLQLGLEVKLTLQEGTAGNVA